MGIRFDRSRRVMFNFLQSKEKTVRISVETIVKCLKTLRLRGHFDLVLNEKTVNTLINELSNFELAESPDATRRAQLLAKSLREALDWEDLSEKKRRDEARKTNSAIQSNFNGIIDDRFGGSY